MKKLIMIISFIFLIQSCDKKKENTILMDFYKKSILVPDFLIVDKKKSEALSCENNLYLQSKEETSFISYELCKYRYGNRGSFEQLKSFFEEECEVLESEVSNLSWIDKSSNKREKYYENAFTFNVQKKYHHATLLAYKSFFMIIRIQSFDEKELNNLIKSISLIKENESLNDIIFNKKECSSCKFPTFW